MKRFVYLFTAVALVVVLWCAGWFFGAGWLRSKIETVAEGTPSVACGELTIGGFPFRFDVTCTNALVQDGDMQARLAELRASVLVYNPTFAEMFALGPAHLDDAFTGASYQIDWTSLQASVRLDWTALARASLVVDELVVSDTVLDVSEMARISHAELHALGADGALGADNRNLRLYADFNDMVLEQVEHPVDAEMSAIVTEWPADIRNWGSSDLLPVWAQGDGVISVETAEMKSGDLSARLTGTLAPDHAGLIDGKLTLTSRGFGPMMRQYLAAPLAGALLGPEDANGESRQDLVFSHSIMRAGIVPLIQVPPLF